MANKPEINNITRPVYEVLMKELGKRPAKINTSNIQTLTDKELDVLKCGDIVAKKTGNQYHAYIVSYKEDKHGICLTYADGSGYIETVSYDYTEGHWVYNSTDVFNADDIKGFDGEIPVSFDMQLGTWLISYDDKPNKNGTFILKDTATSGYIGIMCVTAYSGTPFSCIALIRTRVYNFSNVWFSGDIALNEFVAGTKLYMHSITYDMETVGYGRSSVTFITNKGTKLTIENIRANLGLVISIIDANYIPSRAYTSNGPPATFYRYRVINQDGTVSDTSINLESATYFEDSVIDL